MKRKLLTAIIFANLILLFFVLSSLQSVSAFSGAGSGTLADPYQITNCTQLQEMQNDLSANYSFDNIINSSFVVR